MPGHQPASPRASGRSGNRSTNRRKSACSGRASSGSSRRSRSTSDGIRVEPRRIGERVQVDEAALAGLARAAQHRPVRAAPGRRARCPPPARAGSAPPAASAPARPAARRAPTDSFRRGASAPPCLAAGVAARDRSSPRRRSPSAWPRARPGRPRSPSYRPAPACRRGGSPGARRRARAAPTAHGRARRASCRGPHRAPRSGPRRRGRRPRRPRRLRCAGRPRTRVRRASSAARMAGSTAASQSCRATARVVTGLRPGGSSSSSLVDSSPRSASASVRGMGVALNVSRCGATPPVRRRLSASRWATPSRCCSSTITSASRWKSSSLDSSTCVPISTSTSPEAVSRSMAARSSGGVAPVRSSILAPVACASGCAAVRYCSASGVVGARMATCAPAVTACRAAARATAVLPDPTSPESRPTRRLRPGQIRGCLVDGARLRGGPLEAQRLRQPREACRIGRQRQGVGAVLLLAPRARPNPKQSSPPTPAAP